jgi:hypothetical protein
MALERLRSVPTENSSPDERILERPGAQAGSLSAEYYRAVARVSVR